MNRRRFITSAGVAVSLHAFPYHLFANNSRKLATDRIKLGPKGVELSRLAMGASGVTELFRAADQYGAHTHLRAALKSGIPREKLTIMSKSRASTAAEMRDDLDRFRRELNTGFIDILPLHCLIGKDWNQKRRGAMDVPLEAQAKGIIRTKGISAHTIEALRTSAAEPWVVVQLARVQMKAAGKGVIGSKIFGAGKLRGKTGECLQFAPRARLLHHRRRKHRGDAAAYV